MWNPDARRRFPGNFGLGAGHRFAIRQPIETMTEPAVRRRNPGAVTPPLGGIRETGGAGG